MRGMLQPREQARFDLEPRGLAKVDQALDRDLAAVAGVSQVDGAHRSPRDRPSIV